MAWIKGAQKERMDFASRDFNRELLEDNRFLDFEESKIKLYQFLRKNPSFTSQLLLGVRLFPFQMLAIKGMTIADYSMFVLSRGMSKCGLPNEKVFTSNGMKNLIDVKVDDSVQSLYRANLVQEKTVNAKQRVWTAHTSAGYHAGGLDYHRSLCFNPENLDFDWKFAKDYQKGDIIPIRKGFNLWPKENDKIFENAPNTHGRFIFNPRKRSVKDWYYFFGLSIGDGHYTGGKKQKTGVGISTSDEEIAEWINAFIADVTESTPKKTKNNNGLYTLKLIRKELLPWMISLGFNPDKLAHEKVIPDALLNNSKENICALLSGLYDTDGYCSLTENKKKNALSCRVGFTSSSEELISQVQNLLLNLGAESSTHLTFTGGKSKFGDTEYECRKAWSIILCNSTTIRTFYKNIGFRLERKQSLLKRAIDCQINGGKGYNQKIPCQKYIEDKYGGFFNKNGKTVKLSYGSKSISRPKLQTLYDMGVFDKEDSPKIQKLLDLDIYYDTIKYVKTSEEVTVDLQVANEHCYYSNGFISHNTFSCAVYCILEAILNQGCHIGVIAGSFRQAKMLFSKMEDILQKPEAKLARDCMNTKIIKKGTDMYEMTVGKSRITALPLANGERLRGFRFTQIVLDEFLTIPESIFNEVIMPFLGVVPNPTEREDLAKLEDELIELGKMAEDERYQWPNNKLILLSSPSFKFEYMYKLYCQYVSAIMDEDNPLVENPEDEVETEDVPSDAYRLVMQLSYDCAPELLYDKNLLDQAKRTMSEMQFKREFGAQFVDESDSYFRLSKMHACTIEDGEMPAVEARGVPTDEYILSFDPSWAGNTSSDHFAMEVFKVLKEDQKLALVHSYALAGANLKEHIRYFFYLIRNFNIVGMCGDRMGGQQFIEACNESELFKSNNIEIGIIDVKFDDPTEYTEDLKEFKRQYNVKNRKYCILRNPTSNWIREANELLQGAIDHKRVLFAARSLGEHFEEQRKMQIDINKLKWDIKLTKKSEAATMIDFIENLKVNVELAKEQCANIEVKTNPQGSQTFDLPNHLKKQTGPYRARKDSYSALVLGNWFGKIWFDQHYMKRESAVISTFTPMVI